MASTRSTSERKGMAAAKLDTSIDSEDVPQTARTPSSVSEDSQNAVTGRMLLTSEESKRCPPRGTLRSRIGQRGEQ